MRHNHRGKPGIALVLVLTVLAVTAILGFGLLASNALQAQVTRTSTQNGTADCLAESGIDLAFYYLQNPSKAPSLNSQGYWPGGTGISLGSAVSGAMDVTVVRDGTKSYLYTLTATGKQGPGPTYAITRQLSTSVEVRTIPSAIGSGGSLTLPANVYVKGDVACAAALIVSGQVTGTASGLTVSVLGGQVGSLLQLLTSQLPVIPTLATVNTYTTYSYNGQTYSSQPFSNSGGVINPNPQTNPAGIFHWGGGWCGNTTINGTLVVTGALTVNGPLTISPQSGFPALIVTGNLKIKTGLSSNAHLVVNGVAWLGGSLTASTTTKKDGSATFNGALLMAGGTIDGNIPFVKIYYSPDLTRVADLDKTDAMTKSYRLLSWQ